MMSGMEHIIIGERWHCDIVTLWHDDSAPDQLCRGIATQGRYGDDGVDSGEKQDRKQDIFLYYS